MLHCKREANGYSSSYNSGAALADLSCVGRANGYLHAVTAVGRVAQTRADLSRMDKILCYLQAVSAIGEAEYDVLT